MFQKQVNVSLYQTHKHWNVTSDERLSGILPDRSSMELTQQVSAYSFYAISDVTKHQPYRTLAPWRYLVYAQKTHLTCSILTRTPLQAEAQPGLYRGGEGADLVSCIAAGTALHSAEIAWWHADGAYSDFRCRWELWPVSPHYQKFPDRQMS